MLLGNVNPINYVVQLNIDKALDSEVVWVFKFDQVRLEFDHISLCVEKSFSYKCCSGFGICIVMS